MKLLDKIRQNNITKDHPKIRAAFQFLIRLPGGAGIDNYPRRVYYWR